MKVLFACGHAATVSPSIQDAPICGCGERRIARVVAPAPSIRGVCAGPLVTPQKLDPITVNLCLNGAGPLPVPVDPSKAPDKPARTHAREAH
jgi:hypothetical protein